MNGKNSMGYVIEVCVLFLGIAVLAAAVNFSGVVWHIAVLATFFAAAALNIIRLVRAVKFRRAVNAGDVIFCDAVLIACFRPTRNIFRTANAVAVFDDGGEERVTHMIGVCDERLRRGDRVRIMQNSRDRSMFALTEKQVRGAVTAYTIFTIFAAVMVVVLAFALFWELGHFT